MSEIRQKVTGGTLIASSCGDVGFPGVCIMFETDDGNLIDIVVVESKEFLKKNEKEIDIYLYEDVYDEGYTKKYSISHKDIKAAFES